jgi:hypothetical protein
LVKAHEIAQAIRAMLGSPGYKIGIRFSALVSNVIIVIMPILTCGTSIKSGTGCPQGINALIFTNTIQRGHAARGWPGIEAGKTMPIPVPHEITGSRPETAPPPGIVWNLGEENIGSGVERHATRRPANTG